MLQIRGAETGTLQLRLAASGGRLHVTTVELLENADTFLLPHSCA